MSIPKNFAEVALGAPVSPEAPPAGGEAWASPEGIEILPVYGPEHLAGLDGLDTWPGRAETSARSPPCCRSASSRSRPPSTRGR